MVNINFIVYDHHHIIVDTPCPPVMVVTNQEEGQTAIEDQAAGIRLSELELIVARHHPVVCIYTML